MKNFLGIFGVVLFVLAMIALIGFGPVFTILSLNLLFALSIPITFWTWLATVWLTLLVGSAKFINAK